MTTPSRLSKHLLTHTTSAGSLHLFPRGKNIARRRADGLDDRLNANDPNEPNEPNEPNDPTKACGLARAERIPDRRF
jgi:hypothetical protein